MATKKQYQAIVKGKTILLGGGMVHKSIWFDTKKTAQDWIWAIKEGNIEAGRKVASANIISRPAKKVWY